MRYKLTLQYDGGAYHGWQKQRNACTVQQTVEDALAKVTGCVTAVHASGRTDEGVHALGQTAHFDAEKALAPDRYLAALNYYLPPDIRVIAAEFAPDSFHARKSAKRKTYIYRIYDAPVENPLLRRLACCTLSGKPLDDEAMDGAAKYLIGARDFSAFMSSGSSAKTFTRTIFEASVTRDGKNVTFSITGDGFLYNMVRIITGVLLKIGKGEPAGVMKEILESRDRRRAPDIAPPHGLYLKCVKYD